MRFSDRFLRLAFATLAFVGMAALWNPAQARYASIVLDYETG